jgi:hypothetical protein
MAIFCRNRKDSECNTGFKAKRWYVDLKKTSSIHSKILGLFGEFFENSKLYAYCDMHINAENTNLTFENKTIEQLKCLAQQISPPRKISPLFSDIDKH